MGRAVMICLATTFALSACRNDVLVVNSDVPAAPQALVVSYYGGSVTVNWELAPDWDGEAFRIYSRRITDASWFFIAEVTSCIDIFCTYQDLNVLPDVTYEYYVAAVGSGSESPTAAVSVFVPAVTPPPVPDVPYVIALDGANYLTWGTASRGAGDFSHYKVYLDDAGSPFLLGETDSEGFLDLLADNGITYSYYVTAFDTDGHESGGSTLALGTPRPDYHGEWIYAYEDVPGLSGFFFQTDELTSAVVDGDGGAWDFRIESDGTQWWLRTGTGAAVHDNGGFVTKALKCGAGADFDCTDVSFAPIPGNYQSGLFEMFPQTTYVIRVNDTDGFHYGAIRVEFLGFDQSDAIMIFDWAYQLQAGNINLVSPEGD